MVCMQPDSTFKSEENQMSTSILSLNEHHPAPINLDRLQMWSTWVSEFSVYPTWISNTIDPTLGLERSVDILWLGILLPQLSIQETTTPIWMSNVEHLATLYTQGIDLLESQTIRNLDVSDLKALFPDLMSDTDSEMIQDLVLTYKAYIEFRKTYGHPASDLQHPDWINRWCKRWAQLFGEEPFHFYDLFPSIDALLKRNHRTTPYNPQHITPISMQALWSSGILDSVIEMDTNNERLAEDLCNAAKVTVERLHVSTGLSKGEILLRLHVFFETKHTSNREVLRPWLWGHSPRLSFSD